MLKDSFAALFLLVGRFQEFRYIECMHTLLTLTTWSRQSKSSLGGLWKSRSSVSRIKLFASYGFLEGQDKRRSMNGRNAREVNQKSGPL